MLLARCRGLASHWRQNKAFYCVKALRAADNAVGLPMRYQDGS
jgi:hypothetical protein